MKVEDYYERDEPPTASQLNPSGFLLIDELMDGISSQFGSISPAYGARIAHAIDRFVTAKIERALGEK